MHVVFNIPKIMFDHLKGRIFSTQACAYAPIAMHDIHMGFAICTEEPGLGIYD